MNPTKSVIRLTINGLNIPIKRQGLEKWRKKHDPTLCHLQETYFRFKNKKKV